MAAWQPVNIQLKLKRASKKLDPCHDPDCKYAVLGICKFGLRPFGCYRDSNIFENPQ